MFFNRNHFSIFILIHFFVVIQIYFIIKILKKLQFTHEYRTVEKTGNPCFPENILTEKLNGDEELTKRLLKAYSEEGRIQVVKKTRFTDYYEIIKTGI